MSPGAGEPGYHSACSPRSAGAGRTGTFIALSNILERVKAEGLLDVFQAVKSLRLQRPHMVQTLVRNRFQRSREFSWPNLLYVSWKALKYVAGGRRGGQVSQKKN